MLHTLNHLVNVSKLTDQLLLTNALNFQKRFNHFKNSQVKRWLFLFLASYEECIMKKHVYVSDCSYFKMYKIINKYMQKEKKVLFIVV